jgi:hypothetical protein
VSVTPAEWKRFYSAERARLGRAALEAMLERAPSVRGRALIFPHTRLAVTGDHVAAAARAVIETGADELLAIGVLHGAPSKVRAVHRPSRATRDEFSLDAFEALLALAAERAGRPAPRVHARFPLHVGDDPASLDGIDELTRLAERLPVVATADPIHHGIGYGDAPDAARPASGAVDFARASIETQLRALAGHDFPAFAAECARVRSDFKNAGPALALALGRGFAFTLHSLALVDYAAALSSPPPTWVAGALIAVH